MKQILDIDYFNANRGHSSPLHVHNNMIYGFWMLGANFRNTSKYYGAYPIEYLNRIKKLIPTYDELEVLHLFAGMHPKQENETTFDIKPELFPDICGDAVNVADLVGDRKFDIVLSDPPYESNYLRYNTKPFSKKKVVSGCAKILKPGGVLIWLDTILPLFDKKNDGWTLKSQIALGVGINHRLRLITILEKN